MSQSRRSSVSRVIAKLRGRSGTELRVRGVQFANAWLERIGASEDVGVPGDDAFWKRLSKDVCARVKVGDNDSLLADFRGNATSRLYQGLVNKQATVACLQSRWPGAASALLGRADRILAGKFDLLGYESLDFGSPIDWHLDPVAGKRGPLVHWSRVSYLDPAIVGDHKIVWELNRHQYLLTLGRAYWLTGFERYAAAIVQHLTLWMDANPPKQGVNWASSLEVAFRSLSWIWALHFIRESRSLTPAIFRRVLSILDLHARHVAANLSTYFSPNTHLTGEALGLFTVGLALPQLRGAEHWRKLGAAVLAEQVTKHIRRDGSYVEQSLYYHRYTLDIYLHALILAQRCGQTIAEVEPVIQSALDHAMYLTRPDGTFPLIGDDDGGELLSLGASPTNTFHAALSIGAVLFHRGDYAAIAGDAAEDLVWLLGPESVTAFDELPRELPRETSRAFPDGGYYVMRDGWSADSDYLVLDAGPHGFLSGGHAHADALAVDLALNGRVIFADPGTFVYSADPAARDRFRGSSAHNTVTIDGRSSSEPGDGAFRWNETARTTVMRWQSAADYDLVEASHDGFARLGATIRHERSVLFAKQRYFVIRDRIVCEGDHDVAIHFHCAPGINAIVNDNGSVTITDASSGDVLATLTASGTSGSYELANDWAAPRYGRRIPTVECVFRARVSGPCEFVNVIAPVGIDASTPTSAEVERMNNVWRVSHDAVVMAQSPTPS